MSKFVLVDHEADIENLNLRIQRHGEERILAADIKFSLSTANDVLDQFDPDLKKDLFRKPGKGEQQNLEGMDGLTAVKHPALSVKGLNHEFSGYELAIAGLLDANDESEILIDAKVKKFTIDPKEGGSVVLGFVVSVTVDPDEAAELADAFTRGRVRIALSPGRSPAEEEPAE